MTPTAELLLNSVLALGECERAEIVEALLASFPPPGPPMDEEMLALVNRRASELDSGRVVGVSWEVVKHRARESLGG